MTNDMKYLMHLYACAATSTCAAPPTYPVDFEAVYALADKMSLLSMMAYALKISPNTGCPESIRDRLYAVMLGTSLKNTMRNEAVLELLGEIEKQGIKAVVAKGPDCARFYAKPECRISADTDLFIDKKDEEALLDYLEQHGYTVRRRTKEQHHSECISARTGMIEVHTKIWEDFLYDAMRKTVKSIRKYAERSVTVSINGTDVRVLNPTDAMMFMTLHLVKHVMFSGAGLKMVYDLALYYTHNREAVDAKAYNRWVRKAGYETAVSAAFSAMVLYCGFKKEDFSAIASFDEQRGNRFADGIERYDSGVDDQRPDPALLLRYCTAQSRIGKKGHTYAFLVNAKHVATMRWSLLFPAPSHLQVTYPYLQKHPYLYLVACTHRFFNRGTKHVFHGDVRDGSIFRYREHLNDQMTALEEERIAALKQLDLL